MAEKTENQNEKQAREIAAILFGLQVIKDATGYGTLEIAMNDGSMGDVRVTYIIRPKYLKEEVLDKFSVKLPE